MMAFVKPRAGTSIASAVECSVALGPVEDGGYPATSGSLVIPSSSLFGRLPFVGTPVVDCLVPDDLFGDTWSSFPSSASVIKAAVAAKSHWTATSTFPAQLCGATRRCDRTGPPTDARASKSWSERSCTRCRCCATDLRSSSFSVFWQSLQSKSGEGCYSHLD